MILRNSFGYGEIYTIDEIVANEGKTGRLMVYCTSTACMSVTSDALSWASKQENHGKVIFVSNNIPKNNNMIFVLGCQVTDLAILNDIKTIERLHKENPEAKVYVGGCLAYRFDIELPEYANRLAVMRSEYTPIDYMWAHSINWEKPFWVNDWNENDSELSDGHLFRDMYPLKIGAGCSGNCSYCTIRCTRGNSYETDAFLQISEFVNNDNIVLVSDSPSEKQIKDWCCIAKRYNKEISIRNIEPHVACKCYAELVELSLMGLLKIFHCPIQSNNPEVLSLMNRDVDSTIKATGLMGALRALGTKVATNIIIDYAIPIKTDVQLVNKVGLNYSKMYPNISKDWMDEHFDYWSWNPYFDGHWNREKAEENFYGYIRDKKYKD